MGTYKGKNLDQRAQFKSPTHAWAENVHVVVPFILHMLGSISGESAATLCLFSWRQAELVAEFIVADLGDGPGTNNGASALVGEASERAFRRWDARLLLAVWRAAAARATGPGDPSHRNGGAFLGG